MIPELKIHPKHFEKVLSGEKIFVVRNFDISFQVGDLLTLNEYNPKTKTYTGNSCLVYVDYILNNPKYCKKDMVIMAITPCTVLEHDMPYNPNKTTRDYSVPLATRG
ncbi:MAG: DUF3850 domain-containing protein [Clostridia bacterium]|nr:DUF3850 domain-containing protein [Clostridia bacterium]